MTSDVVLSSALRSNLLSLQRTQSLIDQTQLRLSTGRRVNSALDNPQNFFGAQSLNNRASDLSNLLDGLGQSISAIEQADNAVTSLTTLVQQADSIAQQAKDALSSGAQEAKIVGDVDLSGVSNLSSRTGIDDDDQIVLSYVDTDGTTVATSTIVIDGSTPDAGDVTSIDELVTAINGIQDTANNQVFEAKLNDSGQLEITELNGNRFQIDFQTSGGAADSSLTDALGFGAYSTAATTDGTAATRITVSATAALESVALFDQSDDKIANRTTTLANLTSIATGSAGDIFSGTGDDLNISVNGETVQTVVEDIATATVQDLVDGINTNTTLNTQIRATFDEDTGKIAISAISSDVESIQFQVSEDTQDVDAAARVDLRELGFGTQNLSLTDNSGNAGSESIQLGSAAGTLAELEIEYNNIRDQIDGLVSDSDFRGVNLLNGDNLDTVFNEDRTSTLTTEGVTFTSAGLGLTAADFSRSTTVNTALTQVSTALDSVRSFGGTLANDLAVIQTRQSFTESTINTLEGASDKLTIADQNEEGAKLLALQTRQQLGVTSLSLASQSQQAVLRLF